MHLTPSPGPPPEPAPEPDASSDTEATLEETISLSPHNTVSPGSESISTQSPSTEAPFKKCPADELFLQVSKWATLCCAFLLPTILLGVSKIKSSTAAVAQWLPSGGEQTLRYAQFLEWFDDDFYLVLSWENCRVDDPPLAELAVALRQLAQLEPQLSIRRVVTSSELVEQLIQGPADLTRAAALQRLRGVFVGPDEAAMLLIELSGAEQDQYARVIQAVTDTAEMVLRLPRAELKLGGGVYEAVMVDQASDRSLKRFVIPSSLAALLVAWLCIRNLSLTMVILIIAAYCQLSGVALIYFLGGQLTAVLIVLPTLVFMLAVSAGVHLVNYYRDANYLDASGAANPLAAVAAIRAGFVPCVMASGTTAVGLLSLLVSQLKPVRDFGLFAAIAVVFSTVVLLLVFPTLVGLISQPTATRPSAVHGHTIWKRLANWGIRSILARSNTIAVVTTVLVIIAAAGLFKLKSTVKVQNMFEPQSEILQNYAWLEEHIGPLISVEAVLNFSADCRLDDLQRAELLAEIHRSIARVPEVGGTFSALTFMPSLPEQSSGIRNTARRAVFRKKLQSGKEQLSSQGVLAIDEAGEHWRVTAKVPVLHNLNYGELTDKIVAACRPLQVKIDSSPGVTLTFTGLNPVFHEAQQLLFSDFSQSFAMAFFLIAPIMMLVVGSFGGGLLAMLPNVAPVALVFGVMGWIGVPLDIASILTASVALGIAVDDTLHFTTWFRRGLKQPGGTAHQATEFAFDKCAAAMLQTTCISCSAMLVFLPTEFIPTRKFAILMSVMLAAAVLGDLILLPALLASRLGRWIYRQAPATDRRSA